MNIVYNCFLETIYVILKLFITASNKLFSETNLLMLVQKIQNTLNEPASAKVI